MLDKKDAQWWILEARQHPDKAADLIRLLAERMAFLDRQNEELRGEVIELRRKMRGTNAAPESTALQQRVEALEGALKRAEGIRHLLVYEKGRILLSRNYATALAEIAGWSMPAGSRALTLASTARLLAVSADSRAYTVNLADLPIPTDHPITLDAPRDIVAFLDQAVFESCRYLLLVSKNGFAYSILAGLVARTAQRQDKLIRHLIPDDPIIAAYPTNNADLFAISRRGRWLRFPENTLSGTGTQVLELPKGDSLAGLTWLGGSGDTGGDGPLVFISEDGRLFIRQPADLPVKRGPGKAAGVLFPEPSIVAVGRGAEATILTGRGTLIAIDLTETSPRATLPAGWPLAGLGSGDTVSAVAFS